jgi:hypothetical protein
LTDSSAGEQDLFSFDGGANMLHSSEKSTARGITSANYCSTAKSLSSDLGTAWGDKVKDAVKRVEFEIGDHVADIEVHYASRRSLKEYGIDFSEGTQLYVQKGLPKAFNDGYCTPPSGWQG